MYCIICESELEREESWDGSYKFRCPLCNQERGSSTKAPREEPIPIRGGGRENVLSRGYSRMDWNKVGEEDD